MDENSESSDKPFPPTPKKIEDARKKGDLPRSMDLNVAMSYAGFILVYVSFLSAVGWDFSAQLSDFFSPQFLSGRDVDPFLALFSSSSLWLGAVAVLWPIFLFPAAGVVLSLVFQRGFVVVPDNVNLKLDRISLLKNAKKKFGVSGLFEFFKSFLKVIIFCVVLVFFIYFELERIVYSVFLEIGDGIDVWYDIILRFCLVALLVSLVLGVLDWIFQISHHQSKLRMSHKEVMDEMKNSEGDPAFKQARHQRALEITQNAALRDVPSADVIVVNPTHYAVALKWSREKYTAPECVAKGVDELALFIRRLAEENNVPVFHEPPTARALYATVEIGEQIGVEHYQAVAAAIQFADDIRKRQRELMLDS